MPPTPQELVIAALRALGLPVNATMDDAAKAFRKLAVKWHPDKNKAPEAIERFKTISGAHEELKRFQDKGGTLPLFIPRPPQVGMPPPAVQPQAQPRPKPPRTKPRAPGPIGTSDPQVVVLTPGVRSGVTAKTVRVVVQQVPMAETQKRKPPQSGAIEQAPLHRVRSEAIPNAPTFPVNHPPPRTRIAPGSAEAPMAGLDPQTFHNRRRQQLEAAAQAALPPNPPHLVPTPRPKPGRRPRVARGPVPMDEMPPGANIPRPYIVVGEMVVGQTVAHGEKHSPYGANGPAAQGPGGVPYGQSPVPDAFTQMARDMFFSAYNRITQPQPTPAGMLYLNQAEAQRCPHGGVMTGTLHQPGQGASQGRFNVQYGSDGSATANGMPCRIVIT